MEQEVRELLSAGALTRAALQKAFKSVGVTPSTRIDLEKVRKYIGRIVWHALMCGPCCAFIVQFQSLLEAIQHVMDESKLPAPPRQRSRQ